MTRGLPIALVRRARRRQRRLAIVACALWLLGHEVGPDVHLALHDRLGEHSHHGDPPRRVLRVTYADGQRATPASGAHRHGAVVHRHPAEAGPGSPPTPAAPDPGRHAWPTVAVPPEDGAVPDPDHGARSLAHRTLAIAAPAAAVVAPAAPAWHVWNERADVLLAAAWLPRVTAAARGPPLTVAG